MTGLSELSDSDLRTVADQAYLDTLQAATMAPQSEWHSECFCALHALCEAVSKETGHAVFQDSYGNGVALIDNASYDNWQQVAESIGKNCWDFRA